MLLEIHMAETKCFMLGQCLWRNRRTVAVISVVVTSGEEDIRYVKTFLVKPILYKYYKKQNQKGSKEGRQQ